jgi:hypothetical protein
MSMDKQNTLMEEAASNSLAVSSELKRIKMGGILDVERLNFIEATAEECVEALRKLRLEAEETEDNE